MSTRQILLFMIFILAFMNVTSAMKLHLDAEQSLLFGGIKHQHLQRKELFGAYNSIWNVSTTVVELEVKGV